MNENIDLTKILKDCPKGTKLYSSIHGEVYFKEIRSDYEYSIITTNGDCAVTFTKKGLYRADADGECILFPSREQRDWRKWVCPKPKKPKFDPKTLKAFDRVLARIDGGDVYCWFADFVSAPTIEKYDLLPSVMSNKDANMVIPYNEDTKHLVGTTEEAPEYYRYWED